MTPSKNINLYGLRDDFDKIIKLHDQNKMPNKILLSGKKGLGKSTLAYHFINYIFSKNEESKYDVDNLIINNENKSYRLLNNKTHPNFYLIDLFKDKNVIDVKQIREMLIYANKSSFNDTPKIILIDNIEYLNVSSVNALLKIVEEPNNKIYFILIHNNEKKILPTLKSRCITFNINLSFEESVKVSNLLIKKNTLELISPDLLNDYMTPGEFMKLLEFANDKKLDLKRYSIKDFLNILIDNAYYKKDKFIKGLLINYIELFFLQKYKLTNAKNSLLEFYYEFLNKIYNTEKFYLDEESLFLEFKSKLLDG